MIAVKEELQSDFEEIPGPVTDSDQIAKDGSSIVDSGVSGDDGTYFITQITDDCPLIGAGSHLPTHV